MSFVSFSVLVSQDVHRTLKATAKRKRLSLSEVVRQVLNDAKDNMDQMNFESQQTRPSDANLCGHGRRIS